MRILLLNQFFYPDSAATSQLLTDLARRLAAEGHSVRVICGRSSYAEPDSHTPPAVQIVRIPDLPFGRSLLARSLSYATFLAGALCRALLGPRPHLILTLTTPPALGVLGSLLKSLFRSRHFIWEMDLYPDIAVDLAVLSPRAPLTRLLGAAFDRARRQADGIIALGECMRRRLVLRGIPPARIHIAENWADGAEIHPLPFPPAAPLRILYSGNLGLAHDIDTVRDAIHHLRSDPRFHFAFAGAGPRRPALESFCLQNPNVAFSGYSPRRRLAASLASCHLGLVTQKPETLGSVVPSKTYGLMAAGRPILFIGPADSTPALVLRRFHCGWQVSPGDTPALVALLQRLAANPALIHAAGAAARAAFLQHYDLPIGVARVAGILGALHPLPLVGQAVPPASQDSFKPTEKLVSN